ncbi:hypothetical protein [Mucilaginibacter kameinonensis]|uniref:hypothetical protein n=1 Tax=Mucilaginibacter kameinonensis TaxID=452286 RepID=UPI000EF83D23|nr:hypothetical protein [Mucilaginibacter kameinonensis]
MLQLISKLQHNTYEKGEFSDEQPRDLDEAIQIIKNFPWDAERALTDIQLTGPSVTIQDGDLNYLKLGLYFNGKFCVYYLDKANHLYEYHAKNIDEACNLVTDFFNQTSDLNLFEKHFFNIGNKPHFITNDFIYWFNSVKIFAIGLVISVYFLFVLSILFFTSIGKEKTMPVGAILTLVIALGILIGYITTKTMRGRHQYLQLSKGKSQFSYGYDEQHIMVYDKTDITEISYTLGSKGSVGKIKIMFKNGEFIQPTNLLDGMTLLEKFPKTPKTVTNQRFASFSSR